MSRPFLQKCGIKLSSVYYSLSSEVSPVSSFHLIVRFIFYCMVLEFHTNPFGSKRLALRISPNSLFVVLSKLLMELNNHMMTFREV